MACLVCYCYSVAMWAQVGQLNVVVECLLYLVLGYLCPTAQLRGFARPMACTQSAPHLNSLTSMTPHGGGGLAPPSAPGPSLDGSYQAALARQPWSEPSGRAGLGDSPALATAGDGITTIPMGDIRAPYAARADCYQNNACVSESIAQKD